MIKLVNKLEIILGLNAAQSAAINKKKAGRTAVFRLLMLAFCLQFSILNSQFPALSSLHAQTGSWRAYMAYYEPQQIVKGGNRLYVRASNGLYSYNLLDQSIQTYDKIRQLSDTDIDRIAWNPTVKKLLIIYKNYNIDLLMTDDDVFNIGSYYLKTMTQNKTVNNIYIYEQYAYLCTAFGIVKVNMQRQEISESYILNKNIKNVGIKDGLIYAQTDNGNICGNTSENLIDPHNWSTATTVPDGIFAQSTADWDEYYALVKTLQPGGPRYNNFGAMRFKNGQLYTVGGGYSCTAELQRPGIIQIMKNSEWTYLGSDVAATTKHRFEDVDDIDIDPTDENRLFVSGKTGLYEFKDGAFIREYTIDNSPLSSTLGNTHYNAKNYNLVEGISFDSEGSLWVVNAGAFNATLLRLGKDGEWKTWNPAELINGTKGLKGLQKVVCDSRGLVCFINYHWEIPSFYMFDPQTETFQKKIINPFINQDGTSYDITPLCVQEDFDHNIWIGTNKALFMLDPDQIANSFETEVTQVKVPRNDGTDFADYLLNGLVVTAICIDDAGRKWVGTQNAGLYLISADNMTEVHHFTTDNSPILSNSIESLAVNHNTGEVYIGTSSGLCSYMSDATAAVETMDKNSVYAFPNPVPSGYNGLITIRGLSYDADVKILTISGRLVAQGRSNGGTFTWNGRDQSGRRVASGVYMIATATSEGKAGVVAKVAVVR